MHVHCVVHGVRLMCCIVLVTTGIAERYLACVGRAGERGAASPRRRARRHAAVVHRFHAYGVCRHCVVHVVVVALVLVVMTGVTLAMVALIVVAFVLVVVTVVLGMVALIVVALVFVVVIVVLVMVAFIAVVLVLVVVTVASPVMVALVGVLIVVVNVHVAVTVVIVATVVNALVVVTVEHLSAVYAQRPPFLFGASGPLRRVCVLCEVLCEVARRPRGAAHRVH